MKRRIRNAGGFTLIELLVVIGIIAVLIGLTVTVVARVRRAAYGAASQAQLSTLSNAITQYYADFHAYPGPLPNIQLGEAFMKTPPSAVDQFANDPSGVQQPLHVLLAGADAAFPQPQNITGSENLVLGLLGGLQMNGAGGVYHFEYNPLLIFPDGITPKPNGALSLNAANPRRSPAYLDVRSSDISIPKSTMNGGEFTDDGGRPAADSIIPEFVDQYPDALPILYLRANAGGTAVVGIAGNDDGGNALVQTNADASQTAAVPQYDLAQVLSYTRCGTPPQTSPGVSIGTNGTTSKPQLNYQGLQGIGLPTDVIPSTTSAVAINKTDGLAYFKDPNNPGTSNAPDLSKAPPLLGNARQKNGYILISAGPDRIYGTADDLIYPGSLQP